MALFGARARAGERYEFDKLWFTIEDVGAQLAQLGYHDVPESIMIDFFRGEDVDFVAFIVGAWWRRHGRPARTARLCVVCSP